MIDFHSHILPHMDDGSKNVTESLEIMRALQDQGIDAIVASSHFYSSRETIDGFLRRRQAAWTLLSSFTKDEELPQVILGAEVAFFSGISKVADLDRLKIQGTDSLLLEMPFSVWTAGTISEVFSIINNHNLTPIIAHVERYPDFAANSGKLADLIAMGALLQFNGEYILAPKTRRRALELLKKGDHYLLGSDCHNMSSRPPILGEAIALIEKKLGPGRVDQIIELGRELLDPNQ